LAFIPPTKRLISTGRHCFAVIGKEEGMMRSRKLAEGIRDPRMPQLPELWNSGKASSAASMNATYEMVTPRERTDQKTLTFVLICSVDDIHRHGPLTNYVSWVR